MPTQLEKDKIDEQVKVYMQRKPNSTTLTSLLKHIEANDDDIDPKVIMFRLRELILQQILSDVDMGDVLRAGVRFHALQTQHNKRKRRKVGS